MIKVLKPIALGTALLSLTPIVGAQTTEQVTAVFKYNPNAPAATTYQQAKRTAQKACNLDGSLAPVKRMQERVCVEPMVAKFVIQSGNRELLAYYEARNGAPATDLKLASK